VANGRWVVQPQTPDQRFRFTPLNDLLVLGDRRFCRNDSVFTAHPSAVEVVALEVVQVVQDWRNSAPLFERKPTRVRAFIRPAGSSPTPVTVSNARLKVERPGEAPVFLKAGRTVARADYASRRNDPEASLAFNLTAQAQGQVTLTLEWPDGLLATAPEAAAVGAVVNNATTVTFAPPPPLRLKWVLLDWKFKNKQAAATPAVIAAHRQRLLAALPATRFEPGRQDTTVLKWEPDYDPTIADPEVEMDNTLRLRELVADKHLRDEPNMSRTLYYTSVEGVPFRDNAPIPGNFVLVRSRLTAALYRNRPAHEVGHALGRHHAVHAAYGLVFGPTGPTKSGACDEIASGMAPDYPMDFLRTQPLQPTLGPMQQGDFRLAYGWDHTDGTYITPFRTADLMSYCGFGTDWTWPGLHTYPALHQALAARFGQGGARTQHAAAAPASSLIVTGSIDPTGTSASLEPVSETLLPREAEWPPTGEFTLQLLDTEGRVWAAAPFAPSYVIEADPAPIRAASGRFRFCVPSLQPLGAIEIWHGDRRLVRRTASRHPPELHLLSPVPGVQVQGKDFLLAWQASDLDGDPLTFTVDLSLDGAASWSTLAKDLSGTELIIPAASLPGTPDARLRVTANDGLHRTSAALPFALPDRPPTVAILSPAPEAAFQGAAEVVLRAAALDLEDGELVGGRLRWTSDVDGLLGEGTELLATTAQLHAGRHRLTVIATDAAGQTAQDTVTIQVEPR